MDGLEHQADSPPLHHNGLPLYSDLPEAYEYSTLEPYVEPPRSRAHPSPLQPDKPEIVVTTTTAYEEAVPPLHTDRQESWWKRHLIILLILAVIIVGGAIGGGVGGALASQKKKNNVFIPTTSPVIGAASYGFHLGTLYC
jgi:hypothetical protein